MPREEGGGTAAAIVTCMHRSGLLIGLYALQSDTGMNSLDRECGCDSVSLNEHRQQTGVKLCSGWFMH